MTAKPPVAIRITRPHQTEDEFLAAELDTISRTGVVLVGAQQRPEGVVLRFELTLAGGAPLLRGEGRVIAYKPNVIGNEGGLALRFTRLDSKSKSLVDRVGAMRETRRSSMIPPPPVSARHVDGSAKRDVAHGDVDGSAKRDVAHGDVDGSAKRDVAHGDVDGSAKRDVAHGDVDGSAKRDVAYGDVEAPPPPTPPPDLASSGEIPVVEAPASAPGEESRPSVAQAQDRSGDRFARLRERASRISPEEAARILADGAARRRR